MKILGIETSCDETGVCIIEGQKSENDTTLTVLGNQLYSQVALHEQYGGVFPMMAKREHAKNLVPLLKKCLEEADLIVERKLYRVDSTNINKSSVDSLDITKNILEREPELFVELVKLLETIEKPKIDYITVTNGPGLEPALWVGVTFAKALSQAWNIPLIPTNHMEGHILASMLKPINNMSSQIESTKSSLIPSAIYNLHIVNYPALALLISGGHTQLVLIKDKLDYKIIGGTRDDAVGEAYDKVARMLGLPYPGGPQISKYADAWKERNVPVQTFKFPRPMIHSHDLDFSFSGLKTSVLYTLKEIPEITEEIKQEIAYEFQNAVIDVLVSKTRTAIFDNNIQTLIVGGGVIANKEIRKALSILATEMKIDFQIPEISTSTDNALMIALAGYLNIEAGKKPTTDFKAFGNLSL